MSRRRAPVRARYGRLTALGASLAVTVIALLGSAGALPSSGSQDQEPSAAAIGLAADEAISTNPSAAPSAQTSRSADSSESSIDPARDTALPAGSGSGKRIVFSQSRQRVWLVTAGTSVQRTYLVSGSRYDNLDPGTYSVYSRSAHAWGIDDSGTMRYFVRFTQGDNAAIGFHDIPVDHGRPVQTIAQLGTPLSHGCIRQKEADAVALWKFAPLGTDVVVTA